MYLGNNFVPHLPPLSGACIRGAMEGEPVAGSCLLLTLKATWATAVLLPNEHGPMWDGMAGAQLHCESST